MTLSVEREAQGEHHWDGYSKSITGMGTPRQRVGTEAPVAKQLVGQVDSKLSQLWEVR